MTIYAVNGKEPVSAWIPSLDTAGNGTTTLTDLVGTKSGTLTNMDAATDWVADTGAGGVRALDFDGSNDKIITALTIGTVTVYSMSFWVKFNTLAVNKVIGGWWTGSFGLFVQTGVLVSDSLVFVAGPGSAGAYSISATGILTTGAWHHVGMVYDGSATPRIKGYLNGSSLTFTTVGTSAASATCGVSTFTIGDTGSLSRNLNGRIDDVRVFNSAIDSSDIAYLYNSGSGRGRVLSSTFSPFRSRVFRSSSFSSRAFSGGSR